MSTLPSARPLRMGLALGCLLALLSSGCSLSLPELPFLAPATPEVSAPGGSTAPEQPSATVTFSASLPFPLPEGETLYLSVLDEVTGASLNAANYPMQGLDSTHFSLTLPFLLQSVVHYRYLRVGAIPILEDDAFDRPVRARMFYVTGPGTVEDIVASWADSLYAGSIGRIVGQLTSSTDGSPLAEVLVAGGGQQTLTDSSGGFLLEGMVPGTHNLVLYSPDGTYQTFQQGARVEAGMTTPVALRLTPSVMTEVAWVVSLPADTIENVPVRLAGNLSQLGMSFGDLAGGMSGTASRMPVLTRLTDGRYSLSLALPVGADIRYKYTLGDGFWNAEHAPDSSFVVRQLIVPASPNPLILEDTVSSWAAGDAAPITFEVSVPAETPVTDTISIQFNPYTWTEPVPMWPQGGSRWVYRLFSPLNLLGSFEYRYCRNDQCGAADDAQTAAGMGGRLAASSLTAQDLQDVVSSWAWYSPLELGELVGYPVTARQAGFWTGVEFLPSSSPSWQGWMPLAVQNIQGLFANTLVLSPSWTVSRTSPFLFAPEPGSDASLSDSLATLASARAANLQLVLFPSVQLESQAASFWSSAPRDPAWWDGWYSRYQAFATSQADLARTSGASALVLGGGWTNPALPGADGTPADCQIRWMSLLGEVRAHFDGPVLWALEFDGSLEAAPAFLDSLDGVYLLWYAPLEGSGEDELFRAAGSLLDREVQPFQAQLGKLLVLAAAYPSGEAAASAALSPQELFVPARAGAIDNLQAQVDLYQALLNAVNERPWIGGFVSRGYYPPAALQDASASVHGKPAADVLWYWFSRMQGFSP